MLSKKTAYLGLCFLFITYICQTVTASDTNSDSINYFLDPVTRYIHINYNIPAKCPDQVNVYCSFSQSEEKNWNIAHVQPLLSDTAIEIISSSFPHQLHKQESQDWFNKGLIIERNAAGLRRTVVFNPYPQAEINGKVDITFRVQIKTLEGKLLYSQEVNIKADNSDVFCIEDWTKVLQVGEVVSGKEPELNEKKWSFRTKSLETISEDYMPNENVLYGKSEPQSPLPQLTYHLNLKGHYALFVGNASHVNIRLSGDTIFNELSTRVVGMENFWRWSKMNNQDIVLRQKHTHSGFVPLRIDYLRLVPLTRDLVNKLENKFSGKHDKFIVGYYEPYSWAFNELVLSNRDHWGPAELYSRGNLDLFDVQFGRFGAKCVYESRVSDRLIYETMGDPINGVVPTTAGVGKMMQYTNPLNTYLQYSQILGMKMHANFGASSCYTGTPLQGDFSKKHPHWIRRGCLKYEVPEVRQYILKMLEEVLDMGVSGISIDFCRNPEGIDKPETSNIFLRELRNLVDKYGKNNVSIKILVRFPGTDVRGYENYDYKTWTKEGLVDYLCPSNFEGKYLNLDMAPYLDATKGTKCKLLPVIDALPWGLSKPGPFMLRVKQLYEQGVDGLYFYQGEKLYFSDSFQIRRWAGMLGSSEAVEKWWDEDEKNRKRFSKGIYLNTMIRKGGYHPAQRVRVWLEGIKMGELEMYLDGKLINKYDHPPYVLGSPSEEMDKLISDKAEQELLVRAKDGDGWLEQKFKIKRVNR